MLQVLHPDSRISDSSDGMGHTRYPIILSIVKWKKLERRFSDSGKTVTVDRTRLRKASINNVRIETDG